MAQQRRTKEWWSGTVSRWRRSGQTAAEFATREKLEVGTLRWWSSQLGRDIRAEHGPATLVPLEVVVSSAVSRELTLEIAVGAAVVRCEVGADVRYVAALVRALREN
jgi:hypothetical protein